MSQVEASITTPSSNISFNTEIHELPTSPTFNVVRFSPQLYPTGGPTSRSGQLADERIIFKGELDFVDSTTSSPPSAVSSASSQPTPISDATSPLAQSEYLGYGHFPNALRFQSLYHRVPESREAAHRQIADFTLHQKFDIRAPYISFTQLGPCAALGPSKDMYEEGPGDAKRLEGLGIYLLDHFDNPAYADCRLIINAGEQSAVLMLHGILIAQSPTLRSLFDSAEVSKDDGKRALILSNSDRHVTLSAIVSALLYCYGKPLPQPDMQATSGYKTSQSSVSKHMDSAIALVAAGSILQLPDFAFVGVKSMINRLCFETVTKALSFALHGSSSFRPVPVEPPRTDTTHGALLAYSTYAPYSQEILDGALSFLVVHFPRPFVLDTAAPSSISLGGYPSVHSSASCKPELSWIQFGDFSRPSLVALSSILVSLPFDILVALLGRLGHDVSDGIAESVIAERECRRVAALEMGEAWLEDKGWARRSHGGKRLLWPESVERDGTRIRIARVEGTSPLDEEATVSEGKE